MEQFLGFAIPGIPYGCSYAIVAVALVLTYQATGVFNFAFGAQTFAAALVYTALCQSVHMPTGWAFVISVVIMSPAIGLIFDRFLFSKIPPANTMAKMVTGISLLVGLPVLLTALLPANYENPPSFLFNISNVYFTVAGTPINGSQISAVLLTVIVLVGMVVLMRFTPLGLQMRGAVESRRLVQLDGVNAGGVVATAWLVSGLLAGLAGVILAPIYAQLEPENFATLVVFAIAAAAVGVFRSMPIAALAAVVIGVLNNVLLGYIPTTNFLITSAVNAIPMIVLILALLFIPGLRRLDEAKDPLSSVDPPLPPTAAAARLPRMDRIIKVLWYALLAAFVVSMLTWMPRGMEFTLNGALAFSVLFLSITLITGMGGLLSLAQAALAGVGAFTATLLAIHLGINMLLGALVGAAAAAAIAALLAVFSLRLKGLGLALMTLAFAVLFDQVVTTNTSIGGGNSGQTINPSYVAPFNLFAPGGHQFFILAMIVLAVVTVLIIMIRRGTLGRYLGAMRGSEAGAAGLGINLTWQRVLIFALSGAVAGIGGTLVAIHQGVADPNSFNTEYGLGFVVIVVTTGVLTVEGAIQGAFGFVITEWFLHLNFVPSQLNNLTFLLFAFGAFQYAKHPEGILEFQKRRSTQRFERFFQPKAAGGPPAAGPPAPVAASSGGRPGG